MKKTLVVASQRAMLSWLEKSCESVIGLELKLCSKAEFKELLSPDVIETFRFDVLIIFADARYPVSDARQFARAMNRMGAPRAFFLPQDVSEKFILDLFEEIVGLS